MYSTLGREDNHEQHVILRICQGDDAHYGPIDGIVEHENSIMTALGKKYNNGVISWARRAEDDLVEAITKTFGLCLHEFETKYNLFISINIC